MSTLTVGIIDYGMGNHASITHSLRGLGLRVRVTNDKSLLDDADVMILPGVGAFPAAMRTLHEHNLVVYLQEQARLQRPLVGICLGMQLLAGASYEHEYTVGLELIPGEVIPFGEHGAHIGWNTLECIKDDPIFSHSDTEAFYFNHSYYYSGPLEYQIAITRHPGEVAAIIRRGNVVGLQFHPEKSQAAGRALLESLIHGLANA